MSALQQEESDCTNIPMLKTLEPAPFAEMANLGTQKQPKMRTFRNFVTRSKRDFLPLFFLAVSIASFTSDAMNITSFYNQDHIIFGSLTLFFLLVPGYFGIRKLMKNEQFKDPSRTRLTSTLLYIVCIVFFPIFNISFKARKLFVLPTTSLNQLDLQIDQIKALFEDSPQLALQLFFSSKEEPHLFQMLAICWCSVTVAIPNVRFFMDNIKKIKVENSKSVTRFYVKYFSFFTVFVLASFSRVASFAIICLFLSYNAIIVYLLTYLAIKITLDIVNIICKCKALEKLLNETQSDIIANTFNMDVTKGATVIRSYALFWMMFNVATLNTIHYMLLNIKSNQHVSLWISPSINLTDWSEFYIIKENWQNTILPCLSILNMLSCVLTCFFIKPIRQDNLKKEYFGRNNLDESILKTDMNIETKGMILEPEDAEKIWNPYTDRYHFDLVCSTKTSEKKLSTMTLLEDPWSFVTNYLNRTLNSRNEEEVKHYLYKSPKSLLLKIMKTFCPDTADNGDPIASEIFYRCKQHYQFLVNLEQEENEIKMAEMGLEPPLKVDKIHYDVLNNGMESVINIPDQEETPNQSSNVPKDHVISLIETVNSVALHLKLVSLGLREIQKNFRMLDAEDDEDSGDFKALFKFVQEQIKQHGKTIVPEAENTIMNVKRFYVDYVDYISENCEEEDFDMKEIISEMKTDLVKYKAEITRLEKNQSSYVSKLSNVETKVVESLEQFKALTARYEKAVDDLKMESDNTLLTDKILATWNLITMGISVQVMRQETEPKGNEEGRLKEAIRISEMKDLREKIAITTMGIVIPSVKSYINNFSQIGVFFSNNIMAVDHIICVGESDAIEFFNQMKARSEEVKAACRLFSSEMCEVRTNLAV